MKPAMGSIAIGVALLLGCTPAPAELSDADRDAIRQHLEDLARHVAADDNVAWANDYTEDGIFMIANTPPLRGRAALQAWGESGREVIDISFSDYEISGAGDLAWATSAISVTVAGAPDPDTAKQLLVLERQSDGSWLVAAASVSSDLPLPEN